MWVREETELEDDEVDEGDGNGGPCHDLIQEGALKVCSAVLYLGGVVILLVLFGLCWLLLLLRVVFFAPNVRGPIVERC